MPASPKPDLRRLVGPAALRAPDPAEADLFTLGAADVDAALGGGLPRAALHEVLAPQMADAAAAAGFSAALALRAARRHTLVWVRQEGLDGEAGRLYGPGLAELGLDPVRLVLVRAGNAEGVLQAGLDAVRCRAVGAVLIDLWGTPVACDLVATRRLSFAAAATGVPAFLMRAAAAQAPGAAASRWAARPAASARLAADAPGRPAFAVTLLRHRAGIPGRTFPLEWNRDRQSFEPAAALSRAVVPVPAGRPAAAGGWHYRRAG